MKDSFPFTSAAVITYLSASLTTLDFAWFMNADFRIWIAVIPLYVFLSFILFLIFDIEKTGNEENQYVTKDKAREIAEEVREEMLNTKENKSDKKSIP